MLIFEQIGAAYVKITKSNSPVPIYAPTNSFVFFKNGKFFIVFWGIEIISFKKEEINKEASQLSFTMDSNATVLESFINYFNPNPTVGV